ncbi:MAG: hypothetical protein ACI38U_00255 [Corynebacterium sp.]|uniref:hypothetical protein n=1 Tax=Corynebacterium sp. TaxID=1720 RepID=UPI003EFEB348
MSRDSTGTSTAVERTVDPTLVEYAARVVAEAPALSEAQLDRIVSVFHAGRAGEAA